MSRTLVAIVLSTFMAVSHVYANNSASPPAHTGFAVIKTAKVTVREGLVYAGGSFGQEADSNFSAILVKHNDDLLLFDTGLGRMIAEQYQQDMPLWLRPLFRYEEPVVPARAQLDHAGFAPIKQIILSHSHWDHASAISDFPEAQVWVAPEEMAVIRQPQSALGSAWPSQVSAKSINWREIGFKPEPHEGFARSLDVFDDKAVVLVPLYGHTPGSIGMFVTVDSGKRYFFVGDVIWRAAALKEGKPKFWPASVLVDDNTEKTQQIINTIRELIKKNPDIIVVPAHDGTLQNKLGYFPAWVK